MLVQAGNDAVARRRPQSWNVALRLDGELLERLEAVGDEAERCHVDAPQLVPSERA